MKNDLVSQLSPHLFWDVDVATVDAEKNKAFLIQRVLEYGFIQDWNLLKQAYGVTTISKTAQEFRSLEPGALAFISIISNVPGEQFRCYITRQLTPQNWNF